jgi:transcriptional regulator with XRE-family HTH domain
MPGRGRAAPNMDPRLARKLRELREAAGFTCDSVARKAGWSPSKVSRFERLRTGISVADVIILLDLYDVEGPERAAMTGLAERSSRTPSALYRDQAVAAEIWAPSVVPVPLRIPDYARAVAESAQDITGMLPSEVDDLDGMARAWRRRIEDQHAPLRVRAVFDATVLRRRAAPSDVMHRQVAHLAMLDGLPNVTLLAVTLDAPVPAAFAAFTLLQFGRVDGLPLCDVAMFDDHAEPRTVDEEKITWRCRRAMKELAAAGEPPGGAIAAALAHWSR